MAIGYGEAYDSSTTAYEEDGTLGKKYSILAIIQEETEGNKNQPAQSTTGASPYRDIV
jgi:hypothetical protein